MGSRDCRPFLDVNATAVGEQARTGSIIYVFHSQHNKPENEFGNEYFKLNIEDGKPQAVGTYSRCRHLGGIYTRTLPRIRHLERLTTSERLGDLTMVGWTTLLF